MTIIAHILKMHPSKRKRYPNSKGESVFDPENSILTPHLQNGLMLNEFSG